jgi:hypothetical protein
MPLDTGLFDQDQFDSSGGPLIAEADGRATASCFAYAIRPAGATAVGKAAASAASLRVRLGQLVAAAGLGLLSMTAIREKVTGATAAGRATLGSVLTVRERLVRATATGVATATASLTKLVLPPLNTSALRIGRWHKPAGMV